jgi:hypothetical protein
VEALYSIHVSGPYLLAMKTEQNIAVAVRKVLPIWLCRVFLAAFTLPLASFLHLGVLPGYDKRLRISFFLWVGFSFFIGRYFGTCDRTIRTVIAGNNGLLPEKTVLLPATSAFFFTELSTASVQGLVFGGGVLP